MDWFGCKCSNSFNVDGEQDPQIAMQYVMLETIPLKYISSSTPEGRALSFLRNFSFPPNLVQGFNLRFPVQFIINFNTCASGFGGEVNVRVSEH